MGTDAPQSTGFDRMMGNNVHINLEPDARVGASGVARCFIRDGSLIIVSSEIMAKPRRRGLRLWVPAARVGPVPDPFGDEKPVAAHDPTHPWWHDLHHRVP